MSLPLPLSPPPLPSLRQCRPLSYVPTHNPRTPARQTITSIVFRKREIRSQTIPTILRSLMVLTIAMRVLLVITTKNTEPSSVGRLELYTLLHQKLSRPISEQNPEQNPPCRQVHPFIRLLFPTKKPIRFTKERRILRLRRLAQSKRRVISTQLCLIMLETPLCQNRSLRSQSG